MEGAKPSQTGKRVIGDISVEARDEEYSRFEYVSASTSLPRC